MLTKTSLTKVSQLNAHGDTFTSRSASDDVDLQYPESKLEALEQSTMAGIVDGDIYDDVLGEVRVRGVTLPVIVPPDSPELEGTQGASPIDYGDSNSGEDDASEDTLDHRKAIPVRYQVEFH